MCIHILQNSGWSALFFSSQGGHLKIAELLIAAGAVVDRKDKVTVMEAEKGTFPHPQFAEN